MKSEKRIVRTPFLCLRDACIISEETNRFMTQIALEITVALRMTSGNSRLRVEYRNILDRDTNPDGTTYFFVISDDGDLIDKDSPIYFYQTR